jgi:hypothetical protein
MKCRKSKGFFWLLVVLFFSCLAPSSLFSSVEDATDAMTMETPQTLPTLPPQPILKLPDSEPLSLRLAEALQAWVTWYKVNLTQWRVKLMNSFQILKDSYAKQLEQTQKTIEAKDAVILALRLELAGVRDELKAAQTGAALGWAAAALSLSINVGQVIHSWE